MSNSNIKSTDVILNKISYEDYSKLRSYRFSSDSLEFDDPDRPLPSEEEEQIWWYKNIITKKHIVLAIEKDNSICGVVNAFSFDDINHCCEIGIEIYPRVNFNKGLGKKAIGMFIDYLNKNENIKIVKAETNIMNSAMIRIFEYYCFKRTIRYEENGIIWQCFEKLI